jgi:hypothetical protein
MLTSVLLLVIGWQMKSRWDQKHYRWLIVLVIAALTLLI